MLLLDAGARVGVNHALLWEFTGAVAPTVEFTAGLSRQWVESIAELDVRPGVAVGVGAAALGAAAAARAYNYNNGYASTYYDDAGYYGAATPMGIISNPYGFYPATLWVQRLATVPAIERDRRSLNIFTLIGRADEVIE